MFAIALEYSMFQFNIFVFIVQGKQESYVKRLES